MKLTLAFPLRVSATYVPAGLAALVSAIRRDAPACDLRVVDLNLDAWEGALLARPGGDAAARRLRGNEGESVADDSSTRPPASSPPPDAS